MEPIHEENGTVRDDGVASRTGAVPLRENGNGLVLASGFSQYVMDMLSGVDPEDTIRRKLAAPRYDRVAAAFALHERRPPHPSGPDGQTA